MSTTHGMPVAVPVASIHPHAQESTMRKLIFVAIAGDLWNKYKKANGRPLNP